MKKVIAATINILATAVCLADAPTWSDDDIKADIIGSSGYVCANGAAIIRNMRNRALARCEGDTNRFARLLTEVAHTNNVRIASNAIWMLGRYGSAGDLPFLYSCVTNPACGKDAVASILNIEGVTSNSVAAVERYLTATNFPSRTQAYNRALTCKAFIYDSWKSEVPQPVRSDAMRVVLAFASDVNTSNSIVDEALLTVDASYRQSKRRLRVMRAAYPRCFNEFQESYVTNAINELVAYPEADLPD